MTAPTPLADIFPRFTEADWHDAAARARRGAQNATESHALHARPDTARVVTGPAGGQPWVVVGRIEAASADEAIAAARAEISGGANAIDIATIGSPHPIAAGLPREAVAAVLSALAEGTSVRVDRNDVALADVAQARKLDLVVAFDPVASIATGASAEVDEAYRPLPTGRGVSAVAIADGRPWHAGGASDEQELGIALATFVHHFRMFEGKVDVTLVADTDQFRTIAKFRAMRLLLARIGEVAGIEIAPRIHAETAWRSMSAREPQMNILRATSAAFGAAAGGADSITVLPFDALAVGDGHGRRLARNTQIVLAAEAQMFRVADPAAGSGAIEAMTAALAANAWARFQDIEAEGGIVSAIKHGALLRDVAEAREARLAQVAAGLVQMVGINAHGGDTTAVPRSAERGRLVFRRLAEAYER